MSSWKNTSKDSWRKHVNTASTTLMLCTINEILKNNSATNRSANELLRSFLEESLDEVLKKMEYKLSFFYSLKKMTRWKHFWKILRKISRKKIHWRSSKWIYGGVPEVIHERFLKEISENSEKHSGEISIEFYGKFL